MHRNPCAWSLIEVQSGKSFIDIIVEHIEVLNFRYGTNILLILATSDNTDEPLSQTEYTREVWPVRSKLGEDGRYLTNNGDLFAALAFSGKLEELIAQVSPQRTGGVEGCARLLPEASIEVYIHLSYNSNGFWPAWNGLNMGI
ncbi:unnamed protein product [Sphagnum tenellum]